ncbi:MAG: hypothetical protein WC858_02425 [Parcubacteria group bacterium]|jgi:hypothetical protein
MMLRLFAGFKSGQAEIQSREEGLYRGEIESIILEEDRLTIRFAWLAKGEGWPPLPIKWVKADLLEYVVNPAAYDLSNIGPSLGSAGDRLKLSSRISEDIIIFFPPGGRKLDKSKVEGL